MVGWLVSTVIRDFGLGIRARPSMSARARSHGTAGNKDRLAPRACVRQRGRCRVRKGPGPDHWAGASLSLSCSLHLTCSAVPEAVQLQACKRCSLCRRLQDVISSAARDQRSDSPGPGGRIRPVDGGVDPFHPIPVPVLIR